MRPVSVPLSKAPYHAVSTIIRSLDVYVLRRRVRRSADVTIAASHAAPALIAGLGAAARARAAVRAEHHQQIAHVHAAVALDVSFNTAHAIAVAGGDFGVLAVAGLVVV